MFYYFVHIIIYALNITHIMQLAAADTHMYPPPHMTHTPYTHILQLAAADKRAHMVSRGQALLKSSLYTDFI
jgi:hypothetical protein